MGHINHCDSMGWDECRGCTAVAGAGEAGGVLRSGTRSATAREQGSEISMRPRVRKAVMLARFTISEDLEDIPQARPGHSTAQGCFALLAQKSLIFQAAHPTQKFLGVAVPLEGPPAGMTSRTRHTGCQTDTLFLPDVQIPAGGVARRRAALLADEGTPACRGQGLMR